MLRHAYIAQGHFCFGKAPSESTSRLPNPLVWHLLCAVQETKGMSLVDLNPYSVVDTLVAVISPLVF